MFLVARQILKVKAYIKRSSISAFTFLGANSSKPQPKPRPKAIRLSWGCINNHKGPQTPSPVPCPGEISIASRGGVRHGWGWDRTARHCDYIQTLDNLSLSFGFWLWLGLRLVNKSASVNIQSVKYFLQIRNFRIYSYYVHFEHPQGFIHNSLS